VFSGSVRPSRFCDNALEVFLVHQNQIPKAPTSRKATSGKKTGREWLQDASAAGLLQAATRGLRHMQRPGTKAGGVGPNGAAD
jgi:hypothetical protein